MALADFEALLQSMVPLSDVLTSDDQAQALQLAVARYSQDCPREIKRDVVWAVAGYIGPLPEGWEEGSALLDAEYPIGLVPAEPLGLTVYLDALDGQQLMSEVALPTDAEVRVRFTIGHRLAGAPTPADTIPVRHREALCSYAAHVLCRNLATRYSSEREASIGADGSNTESRARNFSARARQYREAYYAGIGKVDPTGDGAGRAGVSVDGGGAVASWPSRSRNSLTRGLRP